MGICFINAVAALGQCLHTSPGSPGPVISFAQFLFVLEFCQEILIHLCEASCHICLTFFMLGWILLEARGDDHRIIEWFRFTGTLKPVWFQPTAVGNTPATSPGCPRPHPFWPWALRRMGHSQLLWANRASASTPSLAKTSREFFPNI